MSDTRRLLDDAVAARRRAGLVSGLRSLSQTPTPTPPTQSIDTEVCDLCGIGIGDDHRHLLALVRAPHRVLVRGVLGDALGRG